MTKAAKDLAAMRRRVEKSCAECGKQFEGFIHTQYCCAGCKQRAYRARKSSKPSG